jgi:hypothetical protein
MLPKTPVMTAATARNPAIADPSPWLTGGILRGKLRLVAMHRETVDPVERSPRQT